MQDAGFVGCAEHHGAGAVAEQHAGAAVGPVHDAAEHISTDDQSFFGHTAFNVSIGSGDGIHKAGTHGLHIKRGAAADTELLLHDGGSGRELHIGRGSGHDNQINFSGIHTGGFQRISCGGHSQVAAFFVVGGDMAVFDAGTGGNPLV